MPFFTSVNKSIFRIAGTTLSVNRPLPRGLWIQTWLLKLKLDLPEGSF